MLIQVPKVLMVIKEEHSQIREIVKQEKIDIIISDNRYGCWSDKTKNIFICHQLNLMPPVFSSFVNLMHRRLIEKFSECWVPDEEGKEALAGDLVINPKLKLKRIGLLSRMKWRQSQIRYEITVILSGPEPQRSIFERIILNELKVSNKKSLVVKGLPGEKEHTVVNNCEIIGHLRAQEMNDAILESELIISRSGYSTIMDLAMLAKRAIFVPTPGQPEQEYLAKELMKKKITFSMPQDSFNLQSALLQSKEYSGFKRRNENVELNKVVNNLLNEID
jgi:UDP-N-acetylglucosamine transferase subunit ALG13